MSGNKDKKDIGITIKKDENFSEWYVQVMLKAELADYTNVSGCIVYRPRSYAIWEKIQQETDKRFKKIGIKNAYFPLFIPETTLMKETKHIEGFAPEVAWVTHSGSSKLNEKLAIRPTSETIMYESYSKWIRSHRDLPLKLNQWNNVVRWEFKHPVPILRSREFLWNEGHTVFATKKEAEAERKQIIGIYNDICENYMALPSLIGKKSKSETFPGAEYTITMEFFLPSGKAIQGPDFHHDGQIFSKAYDIKFLNKKGEEEFAYQNTWAITTRMLGVMFAIHSDDKGLVMPPRLAFNKLVIVPIHREDSKDKVMTKVKEIATMLGKYNPIIDDRSDVTPGFKFHDHELKGMPLRLEIGPKDVDKDQVVIARRDTGKKDFIPSKDVIVKVREMLDQMQHDLFVNAKHLLESNIVKPKDFDEFKKAISDKKLVFAPWCEGSECEDWIKDKSGGAKTLNSPLKQPKEKTNCVHCGKKAKVWMYFGKSY